MDLRIAESIVDTKRLSLFTLRSTPPDPKGRVLLLGGSNFDLRLKRQFLQSALAQMFEIVTYEPRGIGRSGQPDGDWQMDDYARDAIAVLDALGWVSADVVGESFGGMTALHLALLAPDRVGRLAVASAAAGGAGGSSYDISTFLDLPPTEAAGQALCLQDTANGALRLSDPRSFQERLDARLAFDTAFAKPSVDSGGYARLLAARARHDVWDNLADIVHDTTIISGTRDQQAPLAAQRAMAGRLTNAQQWEYDAGHGVAFARPVVMTDLCTHWGHGPGGSQHGKGEKHD